jgi:hypothetical protein
VALEDEMVAAAVAVLVVRRPSEADAAYSALAQSLCGHDRAVGVDCEGIEKKGTAAMMVQVSIVMGGTVVFMLPCLWCMDNNHHFTSEMHNDT